MSNAIFGQMRSYGWMLEVMQISCMGPYVDDIWTAPTIPIRDRPRNEAHEYMNEKFFNLSLSNAFLRQDVEKNADQQ